MEIWIDFSACIQWGQAVDRNAIHARERASEQNASESCRVRAHGDRGHLACGAAAGIEALVQKTIRLQARDLAKRGPVNKSERAAKQDLPIRLNRSRENRIESA